MDVKEHNVEVKDQSIQVNSFQMDLNRFEESGRNKEFEMTQILQEPPQTQDSHYKWENFQKKKEEQFRLFSEFYQESQCESYELPNYQENDQTQMKHPARIIRLQDLQSSLNFMHQNDNQMTGTTIEQNFSPTSTHRSVKLNDVQSVRNNQNSNFKNIDVKLINSPKPQEVQIELKQSCLTSPSPIYKQSCISKANETQYYSLNNQDNVMSSQQLLMSSNIITPLKEIQGNITQNYNPRQITQERIQMLSGISSQNQFSPTNKSLQNNNNLSLSPNQKYEKVQVKPIIRNSTTKQSCQIIEEQTGTFNKENLGIADHDDQQNDIRVEQEMKRSLNLKLEFDDIQDVQLCQDTQNNNDKEDNEICNMKSQHTSKSSEMMLQLPSQGVISNQDINQQQLQEDNYQINYKFVDKCQLIHTTATMSPQSSLQNLVQTNDHLEHKRTSPSVVFSSNASNLRHLVKTFIDKSSFRRARDYVNGSEERRLQRLKSLSPTSNGIVFKNNQNSTTSVLKNGFILSSRRSSLVKSCHSKQTSYQSLFDRAASANNLHAQQNRNAYQEILSQLVQANMFQPQKQNQRSQSNLCLNQTFEKVINTQNSQTTIMSSINRPSSQAVYNGYSSNNTSQVYLVHGTTSQLSIAQTKKGDLVEKLQDKLAECLSKNAIKLQQQQKVNITQKESCLQKSRSKSFDETSVSQNQQIPQISQQQINSLKPQDYLFSLTKQTPQERYLKQKQTCLEQNQTEIENVNLLSQNEEIKIQNEVQQIQFQKQIVQQQLQQNGQKSMAERLRMIIGQSKKIKNQRR